MPALLPTVWRVALSAKLDEKRKRKKSELTPRNPLISHELPKEILENLQKACAFLTRA
jgi:hypothetical protein